METIERLMSLLTEDILPILKYVADPVKYRKDRNDGLDAEDYDIWVKHRAIHVVKLINNFGKDNPKEIKCSLCGGKLEVKLVCEKCMGRGSIDGQECQVCCGLTLGGIAVGYCTNCGVEQKL